MFPCSATILLHYHIGALDLGTTGTNIHQKWENIPARLVKIDQMQREVLGSLALLPSWNIGEKAANVNLPSAHVIR